MSQYPPPFKIVVALDDSEYAEIVMEHALDQAVRHDTPELHFLLVCDHSCSADRLDHLRSWLTTTVSEGLSSFQLDRPHWKTRLHIREGEPEEEIVNMAAEIQASLLVIGRYGVHRWRKSLTERVVDNSVCPTLVVGLTEHVVDPHPQCPACVEVRAASEGERWFCAEHTDDARLRWTSVVGGGMPSLQGGPLL